MIREIFVVAVMLAVAAGAYLLCTGADVAEAYVFPKTVIAVLVVMAIIQLVESMITAKKIGPGRGRRQTGAFPWKKVATALTCVVVYFAAMEGVGFYCSGFLFFLVTTVLLQKERVSIKSCSLRAAAAGIFMSVLFVLFHVILAVQTPKGLVM